MAKILRPLGVYAFRILLIVVIVELGLRASGYLHAQMQRNEALVSSSDSGYRILALGESNTADLHNGQSSWPRELGMMLNEMSKKKRYVVFNEGTPSSNSEIILKNFEKNLDKYRPDMVIAMMGANDWQIKGASRDTPVGAIASKAAEFRVYKLALEGKSSLVKSLTNLRSKEKLGDDARTETKLKEAMARNPSGANLASLLVFYDSKNRPEQVVNLANTNIPMILDDANALHIAGKAHYNLGNYTMALKYFLNSLDKRSGHFETLIYLSDALQKLNETGEAKKILYSMERARPQLHVLLRLGRINIQENELGEAYKRLGAALYYNPDLVDEVFLIGGIYESINQTEGAIELFEGTARKNPANYAALAELAWHYIQNNRSADAENALSQIKSIGDERLEEAFRRISEKYRKQGRLDEAEKMLLNAGELEKKKAKITRKNYNMLHKIAKERNIRIVAMQYPLLDVNDLKQYFEDYDGIYLVSNRENFEKALSAAPYDNYFIDKSGYKYGHGTLKGNRLIAESAANAIISLEGE